MRSEEEVVATILLRIEKFDSKGRSLSRRSSPVPSGSLSAQVSLDEIESFNPLSDSNNLVTSSSASMDYHL